MKKLIAILAAVLTLSPPLLHARSLSITGTTWAPYQMTENGEAAGLATDVVRQVLARLGIEPRFHLVPWERCIREYERGEADAVYLISPNPQREQFLLFPATPIATSTYVFFIRKSDTGRLRFDGYGDLAGHTVGVTSGYSYSPEFWEGVKKSSGVQETSTDEQNFLKLANGRFDYFPCDAYAGVDLIRKLGIEDKVVYLPKPVVTKDYFLAFSRRSGQKDLEKLVSAFDAVLKEFIRTEDYRKIMKRYLP